MQDYLINARKMQKYIAGECAGHLPEVDLDALEGDEDEEWDGSYDSEDTTDVERGDPARRKTKVIKPRRRRGRKPGGRHPL